MVDKKYEEYVAKNLDAFARDIIRLSSQKSVSARNARLHSRGASSLDGARRRTNDSAR